MTRRVTQARPQGDNVILPPGRQQAMHCEFCESPLPEGEQPENLALLGHVEESEECRQQYGFLLENLRSSWTANMSGG